METISRFTATSWATIWRGKRPVWGIRDPAWEWLRPYLEVSAAAVVVVLSELFRYNPLANLNNKRIYAGMLASWDRYFTETLERIEQARETCHLTSYRTSDIWAFVEEARRIDPEGIMLVGCLPVLAGDNERMSRRIGQVISWTEAPCVLLDAEAKANLLAKISRADYVFIDDVPHPDAPAALWKRSRTKNLLLYTNLPVERVFVSQHNASQPAYYRLFETADAETVKTKTPITFKSVKGAEINYFKNQFLKKTIWFADGTFNYLFFIGGKLFGFCSARVANKARHLKGPEGMYLLCDFVVPAGKSARLAKLLLLVMQTVEFRDELEHRLFRRVPELTSTAFTDAPVSMKYRGIFELDKRGDTNGVKFLTYVTQTGLHDARGAITKWKQYKKK